MTINAPMRASTDRDDEWKPDAIRDQAAVNLTAELLTALHDNGVTYQAIANHLGVNWRTVHRWRNGQTHPSPAGLVNVALRGMLVVFSTPNNIEKPASDSAI